MKQITEWYRQDPKTRGYYYNHYENGHTTNARPTPQSEAQQCWNEVKWLRRHTIMINTVIQ